MNIAYFRKSTFTYDETVKNIKQQASENGLTLLGETELPNNKGMVLHVCNPTWVGNLIASDKNLIGLLPCSVVILRDDSSVTVGVGSPTVLGSVSKHPAITELSNQANTTLESVVNTAAGVGPKKPVAIKLYSTTTCPYCKMEASWLDEQKVKYEEVKVDLDEKAAQAMVEKTGQMGVPVTEVRYDDGEEEYLVGFDRPRLEQIVRAL